MAKTTGCRCASRSGGGRNTVPTMCSGRPSAHASVTSTLTSARRNSVMSLVLLRREGDRQLGHRADRDIVVDQIVDRGDSEIRYASQYFVQRNPQLHPCEMGAQATVRTAGEDHV